MSWRGTTWRAYVNVSGNYWADHKVPKVAMHNAREEWEAAGCPVEGPGSEPVSRGDIKPKKESKLPSVSKYTSVYDTKKRASRGRKGTRRKPKGKKTPREPIKAVIDDDALAALPEPSTGTKIKKAATRRSEKSRETLSNPMSFTPKQEWKDLGIKVPGAWVNPTFSKDYTDVGYAFLCDECREGREAINKKHRYRRTCIGELVEVLGSFDGFLCDDCNRVVEVKDYQEMPE